MADKPESKPVTAFEPVFLFVFAAAVFAIVVCGLVSGWVWIPGGRPSRAGSWVNRADSLVDYLLYLTIVSAFGFAMLAMAVARLRRYNAQRPKGRR